ncbi:MAG: hypothetical protein ABIF77_12105, partial [bacterium]
TVHVRQREFTWILRGDYLWQSPEKHILVFTRNDAASVLYVDPHAWDFEIRPKAVSQAIEFALDHGWDPDEPSPPIFVGYWQGQFVVLPAGVRFSFELPADWAPGG